MGKKGSWFSIIKRFFTCQSGEQLPIQDSENDNAKGKKGGGKLRNGESSSIIPLFRKPSSVEKIFRDFEREQQIVAYQPPTPEQPATPPYVPPTIASPAAPSPKVDSPTEESPKISPPRVASPRACSSTVVNHHEEISHEPESAQRNHLSSAIKIQAAYRGFMARRSFRALKGLVRLQGVIRGNNVRRQTINAKKQMQLLVRVQSQIQSRRIQMLENSRQLQDQHNDKEVQSTLGISEAGNHEDWDESSITKEEKDARLQRKVEAAIKRERAKAYAYSQSHQKTTPKSSQDAQIDNCAMGVPRWLKWLESQLPPANPAETHLNNSLPTPPTPQSEPKSTPRFHSNNNRQRHFGMDGRDTPTPKSTKSTVFSNAKPSLSPHRARTPQTARSNFSNDSRSRAGRPYSPFDMRIKDDDSLVSCPPFMRPHYMTPTISATAKVRARSNPRERFPIPGTPRSEANRRQSFPLTQGNGSFRNKGSLLSPKGQMTLDDTQSLRSVGNLSVDSTTSLPTGIRRKPFNRFV